MRLESQSYIGQQSQSAQRETDDNRILYTDNYGGLNLEASPINIPYADSPALLNMDISLAGRIRKRGGSVLRSSTTGYSSGYICAPVKLPTGEIIIWEKVGTGMKGSVLPAKSSNSACTVTWDFTNLFSSTSQTERPSWVVTEEDAPRLIMVTRSTVPIEIEHQTKELVGDGDTTIVVPGDWTDYFGTTYSYAVFGSTTNKLSNISYSSPNTTFTFASSIAAGQKVTLVSPIFHWWAEAVKFNQDQVYATSLRFNTSVQADANVQVPVEIRRGLFADYTSLGFTNGQMPAILLDQHDTGAAAHTWANPPTSASHYAWSQLEYTPGSDYVYPGSAYVTFGGIAGTGSDPPTPVLFLRFNYLPFNGGTYAQGQHIGVYSSTGTAYTWKDNGTRTTTRGFYWLVDSSRAAVYSGSGTTLCPMIRFDASVPFGLIDEFVEVVNTEPNTTWVGSSATDDYFDFNTFGSFRPVYGLPEFCNYLTGVFPTIISLYQDRIVLSGLSSLPNNIYLSNQGGYGSRFKYQNFQIYMEDSTVDLNPVEVSINGVSKITALTDWFNSLFVFTEDSVKRVYSPNQILTPSSKTQSEIATIGCKSTHAVAKTDRNVVFISDSGVHKVAILEQTSDFYVESVSVKVEKIFREASLYPANSWLSYDATDSRLYVGVSDGYDPYVNQRLLVFFSERESWSEYSLFTGYLPHSYGVALDGRIFINVTDRVSDAITALPTVASLNYLCEFNRQDLVADLVQSVTVANFNAGTTVVAGSRTATLTYTVDDGQRIVKFSKDEIASTQSNYGFKYVPIDNVYLFTVVYTQGGIDTTLVGGTDFINEPIRDAIHITYYPWNTGATLTVQLRDEDGLSPIWVSVDNVEYTEGDDFTVTESSNTYTIEADETVNSNSSVWTGFKYPAYHTTPTFFRQGFRSEKRVTHYVGYYSNASFASVYDSGDVNSSAGQDTSAVADQYKLRANVNVAFVYNDTRTGQVSTDLYLGSDLVWDVSLFDVAHSPFQQYDTVRIVEPIIGIGYNFAVVNYSFNSKVFELIGYQVETTMKGKNSRAWF